MDNKISKQDEYDAKTNRYSNRVVILLELSNGNIAVFNNARELTGVIDVMSPCIFTEEVYRSFEQIKNTLWREPKVVFRPHETETAMLQTPLNLDISKYGDDDDC
jgi:hypothetical protein